MDRLMIPSWTPIALEGFLAAAAVAIAWGVWRCAAELRRHTGYYEASRRDREQALAELSEKLEPYLDQVLLGHDDDPSGRR